MISINYLNQNHAIQISTDAFSDTWIDIKRVCDENSDQVLFVDANTLELPWWSFVSIVRAINLVVKKHEEPLKLDNTVKAQLRISKNKKDRFLKIESSSAVSKEFVSSKLIEKGFKRKLSNEQLRNVSNLYPLPGGATFSVPGAGKTTEALALYYLRKKPNQKLLIIAPKNAFPAWEEQIRECLKTSPTISRLRGGKKNIKDILMNEPEVALITYQQFPNVIDVVAQYYSKNEFTLFLDESHRIKRGYNGVIGQSILQISHLPTDKLIMSGTPMPNKPIDLVPQFNFLYPEIKVNEDSVLEKIQRVYVRTTKDELNIPPYKIYNSKIPMSTNQRRLYELLKSEELRQLENLNLKDTRTLRSMGKSVMRLLQASSNPALLLKNENNYSEELTKLITQGDSTKVDYVVKRARELAQMNRKVIIWSTFVDNIEIINERLLDIGADYIHGKVDSGLEEDEDTREAKIKRFHDDDKAMVLIANPAAASEGISLHTVCHDAIYLDRSYNAAQYLQSIDRIHRFGLSKRIETNVEIVMSPETIDESVDRRLRFKIENMARVLNDSSLKVEPEYFDEEMESFSEEELDSGGFNSHDAEDFVRHLRNETPDES